MFDALLRSNKPGRAIAIFPPDHYLSNDVVFMRHFDAAISAVSSLPVKIVLLGIPAVRPEHDYGWIEPAEQLMQAGLRVQPIFRIGHFWEKPHPLLNSIARFLKLWPF